MRVDSDRSAQVVNIPFNPHLTAGALLAAVPPPCLAVVTPTVLRIVDKLKSPPGAAANVRPPLHLERSPPARVHDEGSVHTQREDGASVLCHLDIDGPQGVLADPEVHRSPRHISTHQASRRHTARHSDPPLVAEYRMTQHDLIRFIERSERVVEWIRPMPVIREYEVEPRAMEIEIRHNIFEDESADDRLLGWRGGVLQRRVGKETRETRRDKGNPRHSSR